MRAKRPFHTCPTLWRRWWPALMSGLYLFAITSRGAEETPAPPAEPPFDSFKIITERNIFDPNRRKPSERTQPRVERPAPPKIDRLELVGTLISKTNALAFFVGTESSYQGAFKKDAAIADHKILAIQPESVRLEMEGGSVEFKVGQQMTRREGEAWQMAAENEKIERSVSVAQRGSVMAKEETKPAASGDSTNDILKRLMERRKQELQQ